MTLTPDPTTAHSTTDAAGARPGVPESVIPGSESDLSDYAATTEREFAATVRALGGIPQALAAGLDPWQLPDGDVRSVWLELQRCWDQLKDLTDEAADALTRAEHHHR